MADPRTTLDAVDLPSAEAIAFLRGKTNVTSKRWTDVWNEAHTQSFMVAGAATKALVQDFRNAVAKAIEQGVSIGDFRRDFDAIVAKHGWVHNGEPGWRASIIYETNLSTAYSAGRYAQMSDPDVLEVYPYWQYMHTSSARPRPQHLAWVGTTLPADDPWWSTHYPPNGWRCKCSVRPVSERDLRRQGKRGPDTAPPLDMRPWRSRDGRVVTEVPHGIDPGFGYNPGQAWKDGLPPPTAPKSPLQPVRPHIPPAEAVEAPAMPTPSVQPPSHPEELLDALRQTDTAMRVGPVSASVREALGTTADQALLSPETMRKQLRAHPEMTAAEYAQIPVMLMKPDAAGPARKGRHMALMRWHDHLLFLVIKATQDGREIFVQSFRRANPRDVRDLARAGILIGSLAALERGKEE